MHVLMFAEKSQGKMACNFWRRIFVIFKLLNHPFRYEFEIRIYCKDNSSTPVVVNIFGIANLNSNLGESKKFCYVNGLVNIILVSTHAPRF